MTTREKGTGLGLAIVRKVMEEHGGMIDLLDAESDDSDRSGAVVRLTFPDGDRAGSGAEEARSGEDADVREVV